MTNFWSPIDLYFVKCTKFGQLILRKISHIVATRCHNLRLKCTKFDFGSAPDPARELTTVLKTPSRDLKEPTFNGKARKGKRKKEREKGA